MASIKQGLNLDELNNILKTRTYNFSTSVRYKPGLRISSRLYSVNELTRNIDKGAIRAILNMGDIIKRNLALAITSDIWRTNNGLDDIYISGELLNSVNIEPSNKKLVISYDVPYAALIHYGGYISPYGNESSAKVYIPPRPWISAVLNGTNGLPEINYRDIIISALASSIS